MGLLLGLLMAILTEILRDDQEPACILYNITVQYRLSPQSSPRSSPESTMGIEFSQE